MKNILYILIFIPSLLFSQETKNMELVGVRNITVTSENPLLNFEIDDGNVLKIMSVTHSGVPSGSPYYPYLKLNFEYLYYAKVVDNDNSVKVNTRFPFYLNPGSHSVRVNDSVNTSIYTATIYCLEFKLTTP